MAAALPRPNPDAHRGLSINSPCTRAIQAMRQRAEYSGLFGLDALDTKHCIINRLSLAEGTGFEPSLCQLQLFEYPCVLCLRGSLRLIPNALCKVPSISAHHHRPLLRSIVMAGGSTVVAYFRSQSPLDYEFAAHKRSNEIMESPFSNVRVTPSR